MFKYVYDRAATYAKEYPTQSAIAGAAALIVGLWWLGGSLVMSGLILGLLLSTTFGIILWKVRSCQHPVVQKVYSQLIAHPILTDIGLTMIGFMACPTGIAAYIGASVCGVLCSVWLMVEQHSARPEMKEIAVCQA